MEGRAKKFISIYWINLTELPKNIPSEFSHLLQLHVEEVDILLLNTSSNFAKIFQPVFEAWCDYVKKFHNKLIVDDKSSESDCDALQEAYKVAIEEYRFQVNLTWDRNRFFLMSGMTGISVAIAMMKFSDHVIATILIPLFFALSSCLALLGLSAQNVGKLYYRRTLNHLFDVINLLNTERAKRNSNFVAISAFTTTKGMKARDDNIDEIDTSSKINNGSFSMYLRRFFMLIVGTGFIGMVSSIIYYIVHYKVFEKIEKLITCIATP